MCVSNIKCAPGVVDVYDSISFYSVHSYSVSKQVAGVLHTSESSFQLQFPDVQRQCGGADCGLFAIAFATALCFGQDPYRLSFNQQKMRNHLMECFKIGEMSPFPPAKEQRRLARHRLMTKKEVKVYCTCRLPWMKTDDSRGGMIQCSKCSEWHHQLCLSISDSAFIELTTQHWFCTACMSV